VKGYCPLPDIPSVTMKMRTVHCIELDQIKSSETKKSLLSQVQQPNVSIYVFWPAGTAIDPLIGAYIREQFQELSGIEEYWYKNPNADGDFIHIGRDPELESQKRIQETQPMFCRAELKLPKRRGRLLFMGRRKNKAPIDGEAEPKTEPSSAHSEKSHAKEKEKSPRGPKPGTLDRFGNSDRALFPEIERIMSQGNKSAYAACYELAESGEVKGVGSSSAESRAKRLLRLFKKEHPQPTTR
jgi:hypothetical protein